MIVKSSPGRTPPTPTRHGLDGPIQFTGLPSVEGYSMTSYWIPPSSNHYSLTWVVGAGA